MYVYILLDLITVQKKQTKNSNLYSTVNHYCFFFFFNCNMMWVYPATIQNHQKNSFKRSFVMVSPWSKSYSEERKGWRF